MALTNLGAALRQVRRFDNVRECWTRAIEAFTPRSSPAARLDPKAIDAERSEGFSTTASRRAAARYPSTQR